MPCAGAWITGAGTGAPLCSYDFQPKEEPRAVVVFLHGVGEHARRYDGFFRLLNSKKIHVVTYDCVGHGASDGLPGYIHSFDDVVKDARGVLRRTRERFGGGVPVVLCGQSFGGLVAATVAAMEGAEGDGALDGLVLTAASVDVHWTPVLRAQAAVGAALAAAAPKARWVPAVRLEDMTSDAATLESYASDPYVQLGGVRCKTAYEILRGFRSLRNRYQSVRCPLLVLHGGDDACADKNAARRLVSEALSSTKEYVEFAGMHHLILQEPGSDAVQARVVDFIENVARSNSRRRSMHSSSSSLRSRL